MLGNVEDKMAQAKSQGISKGSNNQLGSLSQRYSTSGNLCYRQSLIKHINSFPLSTGNILASIVYFLNTSDV